MSPLAGETTFSFLRRIAARYGMDGAALLAHWQWHGHRPRHEGGARRADAEVLLDGAGRSLLAGLCEVGEDALQRALPAWGLSDDKLTEPAAGGGERAGASGRRRGG
ncbi:hypothetical protein [Streptomyces tateyamensis]|nr:hypothetical protein [Streptomyces tateyamensis]